MASVNHDSAYGSNVRDVISPSETPDSFIGPATNGMSLTELASSLPEGTIQVLVASTKRTLMVVEGRSSMPVGELKEKIKETLGIKVSKQILRCGESLNIYDSRPLSEFGSKPSFKLLLRLKVVDLNGDKNVLSMNVDATVKEVKQKLVRVKSIPLEEQRLVFKTNVLENNQSLLDSGVAQDPTCRFVRISMTIKVKVSSFDEDVSDEATNIVMHPSDTIASIRPKVEVKMGIPVAQQKNFLFAGNRLEDSKPLSFYRIKDQDTIYVGLNTQFSINLVSADGTEQFNVEYASKIRDVKALYGEIAEVSVERQLWRFDGNVLENEKTLEEYGITADARINLELLGAPSLQLVVKMTDRDDITVSDVSAALTVADLKQVLQSRTGVAANRQGLIFRAERLQDERTLEEYRMKNLSVIRLHVRSFAGAEESDREKVLMLESKVEMLETKLKDKDDKWEEFKREMEKQIEALKEQSRESTTKLNDITLTQSRMADEQYMNKAEIKNLKEDCDELRGKGVLSTQTSTQPED